MTDLIRKETMSSLQISEVTGKRHADVLRDIRNLVQQLDEEGKRNFALAEYLDEQRKKRPMYELTKKGCLCLASGYDANLRMKIINRWEELEIQQKQQFQVPTTFAEALRLAAQQQEQIEQQQKLIEVQKPKAEFYDDVVESKDALPMDMVAKTLNTGLGRNKLFAFLRDNGVLMRSNAPFQRYVDLGWFRCIETKFNKPNGDTCINIKTVVLQKGLDGIRKLLKERNKEITQSKKNYK